MQIGSGSDVNCMYQQYLHVRQTRFLHGATSWTDWIKHFEAVAVLNDWDDAAKLSWLPVRLSGKAQTAWKRLSPEVKADYKVAREALEKRLEPESKRTLYFFEF